LQLLCPFLAVHGASGRTDSKVRSNGYWGNRTRVPSRLTGSTCPRQGGRSSQSESATRGSALTCRPWVSSVATIPATPVACSRKRSAGEDWPPLCGPAGIVPDPNWMYSGSDNPGLE